MGETIQVTLSENVLHPFEESVSGIADRVASQVDRSAQRTENILKTVISALIVILGVFAVMYMITRRQLQRARANSDKANTRLRSVGAAVEMLDDAARTDLLRSVKTFQRASGQSTETTGVPKPSDGDYTRDDP